jgi:serine/threonine protein kinase
LDEFQERYQVERQIGSGSFGHVFLVKDTATGELAAAKYQKQEVWKVRAEVAMLSALIQSAFVVQLVGLYEGPLNSVLVTEYLAGGDLITRTAPDDYCLTERSVKFSFDRLSEESSSSTARGSSTSTSNHSMLSSSTQKTTTI